MNPRRARILLRVEMRGAKSLRRERECKEFFREDAALVHERHEEHEKHEKHEKGVEWWSGGIRGVFVGPRKTRNRRKPQAAYESHESNESEGCRIHSDSCALCDAQAKSRTGNLSISVSFRACWWTSKAPSCIPQFLPILCLSCLLWTSEALPKNENAGVRGLRRLKMLTRFSESA